MGVLRALDRLAWDDRYEPFRHLGAWLVVVIAVVWFGHAFFASWVGASASLGGR